jgi:hypothetical protein
VIVRDLNDAHTPAQLFCAGAPLADRRRLAAQSRMICATAAPACSLQLDIGVIATSQGEHLGSWWTSGRWAD